MQKHEGEERRDTDNRTPTRVAEVPRAQIESQRQDFDPRLSNIEAHVGGQRKNDDERLARVEV